MKIDNKNNVSTVEYTPTSMNSVDKYFYYEHKSTLEYNIKEVIYSEIKVIDNYV